MLEAYFCRLKMGLILILFSLPIVAAVWVQRNNEKMRLLSQPLPGFTKYFAADEQSATLRDSEDEITQ